jgi:hypothetical protein
MVGNVVALLGENRIAVRIGKGGGRVLQSVVIADGVDFQANDRVLLGRISDKSQFVAITKVLDTAEHGIAVSDIMQLGGIHAPGNFQVEALEGFILASWEGWSGDTLCFQVQHNSSAAETGATNWYTRGSHYLYDVGKNETRHFRVRSIRYDVKRRRTYYSGWTDWESATAIGVVHLLALAYAELDHELTMHVVHGT